MQESGFKSYDELPLFLNAKTLAKVLGVSLEGDRRIFAEADDVLFVPRGERLFAALPELIPLQFFAYYIARENGCAIDKPRNLAKSVTVE